MDDNLFIENLPFKDCDDNELSGACSTNPIIDNQETKLTSSLIANNYLFKGALTIKCLGNA